MAQKAAAPLQGTLAADVFLLTVDERGSVVCVRKEEVTP